jgi:Cdc6-like AAA superfamily ATPase
MNKEQLEQIIKEELEAAINEEELDEQSFLKRVASAFKGSRLGDQRRAQRAKNRATNRGADAAKFYAPTKPSAKVEPDKKQTKTISLTKDIFPDLMDSVPPQDRTKLTKLAKAIIARFPEGMKVSNSDYQTQKSTIEKRINQAHEFKKTAQRLDNLVKKELEQMPLTTRNAKSGIKRMAKNSQIDDQVITYLLNYVEDDSTIIESVIAKVIVENLNGNKVIL